MKFTNSQQDAIDCGSGNIQLIACAGSGKTEVISRRVTRLLKDGWNDGLRPENIVAFTFTERAAAELKDRIVSRVRETMGDVIGMAEMYVGTIHGFCLNLLQTEVPKFLKYGVLNEVQQVLLVNRNSRQSGLTTSTDLRGQSLRRYVETTRYIEAVNILREARLIEKELAGCSVVDGLKAYHQLLDEKRYLDYSGILLEAVTTLAGDKALKKRLAERIKYVTVDEYQDVNPIQECIVNLLHQGGAEICVVGDDDQTIYQWRGSDITNILTFETRYPDVTAIRLQENFRSSQGIVETARRFIKQNTERLDKAMIPTDVQPYDPGDIVALSFDDPDAEAEYIVETIQELHAVAFKEDDSERGLSYSDFAVLLRSVKANGSPIVAALREAGKKIIQATVDIGTKAKGNLSASKSDTGPDFYEAFDSKGNPKYPIGQIIFDMNGEYANANMQDEGTAIFELYKEDVLRYSVEEKQDFKVMKVNFYEDVLSGFGLAQSHLASETGNYVQSFVAVDMTEPDATDRSASTRYRRLRAAYLACLSRAGFIPPKGFKVKFAGNAEINNEVAHAGIDPSKGITLEQAVIWFEWVWNNYSDHTFFSDYRKKKGREWADENLQAMLIFLTRKRTAGGAANVSGYQKLRSLVRLHTPTVDKPFSVEIVDSLRGGKIVMVDLSQGDPDIQSLFSERICRDIFADAMRRFVSASANNFIQFYFEEAHNLFPKKDDRDLSQIYNRIAKEGAKLNLGLIYATQEVSSISANILKNTQNWFIAHLNNEDETREIRKYYDFGDFTDSLVRFSSGSDKGYVRMKTYSNAFVVPVQIDRFSAKTEEPK